MAANQEAELKGKPWRKQKTNSFSELFRKFSNKAAAAVGKPWAFAIAAGAVLVWALTGPMFKFSDTWQLVINTSTTIITFLMVFLIQNTQNRDAKAIHLKLDELLRASKAARNSLIDIEEMSEEELHQAAEYFHQLRAKGDQRVD